MVQQVDQVAVYSPEILPLSILMLRLALQQVLAEL
jgi:hypothetical protein